MRVGLTTTAIFGVVGALDLRSTGRGFDFRPLHCQATTSGKLFTPMCLFSPSSIIWYLARAFMLTRLYVAAIHGSNEQGEYCSSGSAAILIAVNRDINFTFLLFCICVLSISVPL